MTISYSYLVLNDKNIKKLKNKFNLDIDDILHLARNGDINLYIRVENIEAGTIIKTEFDECFSLSSFVNSDKKDRCYKDFFNVADYNIQIPSRTINESARKIVLDELSAYYFLRDEYGKIETDFILNFSFPNKSLQVPIPNTYILISQLSEVVADELNSIQMNDNSSEEIKKLKSELEEKDKKITELQTALGDKNVPILLGAHRNDDPLKIAIEVRNKYWANYPDNVKSNTQIRDYIIRDYGVTQTLATEIEKIACPIDRKKN